MTAVANIVCFLMLLLTGAALPLELMPNVMIKISTVLPLTYAVNLLKGVWLGKNLSDLTTNIWVLLGILVVCSVVSIKKFRWE